MAQGQQDSPLSEYYTNVLIGDLNLLLYSTQSICLVGLRSPLYAQHSMFQSTIITFDKQVYVVTYRIIS